MKNEYFSLNRWIFESFTVTPEGLGLLRIFTALFLLFFLIPGGGIIHYQFLASLPAEFYAPPPGPMMLFDSFPGIVFFQVLLSVTILSVIMILVGYYTSWASMIAGLSVLVLQGFIFSIGKIDHEILVALVPIILTFSNWGAAFSIDSLRKDVEIKTESWPLTLLALIIGFMMFTAGFPKLLGGWLDVSTQAAQSHLFNQFYVRERQDLLAKIVIHWNNQVFWELLDWATVLFELGFLVSILRTKWFRCFIGFAILFHFSTMMIMNIAFLPNFIAYAVFLKWNAIYQSINHWIKKWNRSDYKKSRNMVVICYSILVAGFFILLKCVSLNEKLMTLQSDLMLHEVIMVSITTVFVMVSFLKKLWNSDKNLNSVKI